MGTIFYPETSVSNYNQGWLKSQKDEDLIYTAFIRQKSGIRKTHIHLKLYS